MTRTCQTYFLLLVCLLMQAVAVFPHHHHADGICLHTECAADDEPSDLPADGELAGTLREISLLLFSSAERISALCMENHIPFSDAFRFRYSLAETDRA